MTIDSSVLVLFANFMIAFTFALVFALVPVWFTIRWADRQLREQDAEIEEMIAELEAEWFDEEAGVWRAPDYARRAPG